jgi:hypothetical protein
MYIYEIFHLSQAANQADQAANQADQADQGDQGDQATTNNGVDDSQEDQEAIANALNYDLLDTTSVHVNSTK